MMMPRSSSSFCSSSGSSNMRRGPLRPPSPRPPTFCPGTMGKFHTLDCMQWASDSPTRLSIFFCFASRPRPWTYPPLSSRFIPCCPLFQPVLRTRKQRGPRDGETLQQDDLQKGKPVSHADNKLSIFLFPLLTPTAYVCPEQSPILFWE